MHQVVISRAGDRAERDRVFSANDLYEIIAISVLAPASWLVPHRLWHLVSLALSFGIAILRPDITRRRILRLRRCLEGRSFHGSLFGLRVRIMAGYMEERMQILREYRPGGWRGVIELKGGEHLTRALEQRRGVVLWISPFTYSDLIAKTAMARAGVPVSHLGACSRGFSPNSCHPWVPTRFGKRYLSRLRTTIEDRFLKERIMVPADGALGYIRQVERLLRAGGVLSIRAGKVGSRAVELPLLGGSLSLATGAPNLAVSTGAALLPVFVIRRGTGRFEVVVEPALEPEETAGPQAAVERMLRRYVERLESYVVRFPFMWSGWYSLSFPDTET